MRPGFILRYVLGHAVWLSASVERLIRPGALASAVRDHMELARQSLLPVFSTWYLLPLLGRHVGGSRLRVGMRTELAHDCTLIGLTQELPARRGGRSRRGR